jgi:hypothetical protein
MPLPEELAAKFDPITADFTDIRLGATVRGKTRRCATCLELSGPRQRTLDVIRFLQAFVSPSQRLLLRGAEAVGPASRPA